MITNRSSAAAAFKMEWEEKVAKNAISQRGSEFESIASEISKAVRDFGLNQLVEQLAKAAVATDDKRFTAAVEALAEHGLAGRRIRERLTDEFELRFPASFGYEPSVVLKLFEQFRAESLPDRLAAAKAVARLGMRGRGGTFESEVDYVCQRGRSRRKKPPLEDLLQHRIMAQRQLHEDLAARLPRRVVLERLTRATPHCFGVSLDGPGGCRAALRKVASRKRKLDKSFFEREKNGIRRR